MNCKYVTGISPEKYVFDCTIEATNNSDLVTFLISSKCTVDWGDGNPIEYDRGFVSGIHVGPDPIHVSSSEKVTSIYFSNGASQDTVYKSIIMYSAPDIIDATNMCRNLVALESFDWIGTNRCQSFESMFDGCIALENVNIQLFAYATTISSMFQRCGSLMKAIDIYAPRCIDASYLFSECSSIESIPILELPVCENFSGMVERCVSLKYVPDFNTSAGKYFDYMFAYCSSLDYFPSLDFSNAVSMDYAFAYNYKATNMPNIDSPKCESFKSLFRNNMAMECIGLIDTTGIPDENATADMFLGCDSLTAPDPQEQYLITQGHRYINDESCYYDAGNSRFFVKMTGTGSEISFSVTGAMVEVDWGDGTWIPYHEGEISGIPILTNSVQVRSLGSITNISFNTDTMSTIEIKRCRDLLDVSYIAAGKKNLQFFELMEIPDSVTSLEGIVSGCSSLTKVYIPDLTNVKNLAYAFDGCSSINQYIHVNAPAAEDLRAMFRGCSSLERLGSFNIPNAALMDYMFYDCTSLRCIDGFSSTMVISSDYMFTGCHSMIRPNDNEKQIIYAGDEWSLTGPCEHEFDMSVLAAGKFTINVDAPVWVDLGDGTFVQYPAGDVTITPTGRVYVYGDVSSLSFVDDVIEEVVIINAELITDYADMFNGFTNLKRFYHTGVNNGTSFDRMFKDTSSLTVAYFDDISKGTSFVSMFESSNIVKIDPLNTESGTHFDNMFKNARLLETICEINTTNIQLGELGLDCSIDIECDDVLQCSMPANLFEGCVNLTSPDATRQVWINNGYHFIGTTPC